MLIFCLYIPMVSDFLTKGPRLMPDQNRVKTNGTDNILDKQDRKKQQ